jgi:hypothetical protein
VGCEGPPGGARNMVGRGQSGEQGSMGFVEQPLHQSGPGPVAGYAQANAAGVAGEVRGEVDELAAQRRPAGSGVNAADQGARVMPAQWR